MSRLAEALGRLRDLATPERLAAHARFALPEADALGVEMRDLRRLRREIGADHALALELWGTGLFEARLLAGMLADPAALERPTAERWIADFDNWAVTDTLCFDLLDRTPYRWELVDALADAEGEFRKRAAFALIWSLTRHDKAADDARFTHALGLIEAAATDPRSYVRKGVDMALRATGKRNRKLNAAALVLAERLAGAGDPTARRIGRSASRELSSQRVVARLPG